MGTKVRLLTQAMEFASGNFDLNSSKIVNLANATANGDAINKGQLDSAISQVLTDLSNGLVYKGLFDASVGTLPADASQGDFYKVSVAGTIGTLELGVGDMIIANNNVTGGTSAEADWDKIDNTEISHAAMESDISDLQADKLNKADIVENEVLTITDGSPTPSALANTPVAGSVKVYVNGIRQTPTVDFSIVGTQITFTYNLKNNPGQADSVIVDYRK